MRRKEGIRAPCLSDLEPGAHGYGSVGLEKAFWCGHCTDKCHGRADKRGDRAEKRENRAGEREEDNCVDKREDRAEKCVTDGGRAEKRVLLQIQHISETYYPRTA